jgi:hypothetical protein
MTETKINESNTGTDEELDTRTAEELDREMRATLGLDLEPAPTRFAPLPPEQPYLARHIGGHEREAWDVDDSARPTAVAEAAAALTETEDRANELAARLAELPSRQAQAAAAFEREAVTADREGRTPRLPKAVDWARERAVLEAQHRGRRAEYDRARQAYRAAVQASKAEWLQALLARREPARDAAIKALTGGRVADAVAACTTWRTLVIATAALWEQVNPTKSAPPTPQLGAVQGFGGAVQAALGLLTSDDEAVTGSWMTETLVPSRWERKRMAESGGGAAMELLHIELEEAWAHTSFTKPMAAAFGYLEIGVTPSGQRFQIQ